VKSQTLGKWFIQTVLGPSIRQGYGIALKRR